MIDDEREYVEKDDFELVNKGKGRKFHKRGGVHKALLPYLFINFTYFHKHCRTFSLTLTDVKCGHHYMCREDFPESDLIKQGFFYQLLAYFLPFQGLFIWRRVSRLAEFPG